MKLFVDMSPTEKIDHIERCLESALPEVLDVTCLADILNVWDYWAPYMIQRLRKLEAVVEAAIQTREAFAQTHLECHGVAAVPPEMVPLCQALTTLEIES